MHLLNVPLSPRPHPSPPLLPALLRLYESMNAVIQNRLWGLFFFLASGRRCVWCRMVHPALAPCIPGSYSPLMSSFPFFVLFFSIAKYLALLHNPPSDFSPINPSTRPFPSRFPYFSRTLSSGLSPPRSSSL